jgi:L-asparaginase II
MSCNTIKQLGMCAEWSALLPGEIAEAKGSCSEPGALFSSAACPTAGVLATCEHRDEKVKMYMYKSAAVPNLKAAKEICDDGVFAPAR